MKYSGQRKLWLCELSKLSKLNAFIIHRYQQRELDPMCTQSIGNCNQLSLHYNLGYEEIYESNPKKVKQLIFQLFPFSILDKCLKGFLIKLIQSLFTFSTLYPIVAKFFWISMLVSYWTPSRGWVQPDEYRMYPS